MRPNLNIRGNLAQCRKSLVDSGYLIIRGFIKSKAIEELRMLASADRAACDQKSIFFGPNPLIARPDILVPLISSKDILVIVESIIGPFVQLDSVSLVGVPPNAPNGIFWHRDVYGAVPRCASYQPPRAVNLLVYLQDIDDITGLLRLIPGSHRTPLCMDDESRRLPHADEMLIPLLAGDAVLIDTNLVHSRSENRSDIDRMHLSIIYNHSCMRTAINYADQRVAELQSVINGTGDLRLMRLFGNNVSSEDRYNAGFMEPDEALWRRWNLEDGYVDS